MKILGLGVPGLAHHSCCGPFDLWSEAPSARSFSRPHDSQLP